MRAVILPWIAFAGRKPGFSFAPSVGLSSGPEASYWQTRSEKWWAVAATNPLRSLRLKCKAASSESLQIGCQHMFTPKQRGITACMWEVGFGAKPVPAEASIEIGRAASLSPSKCPFDQAVPCKYGSVQAGTVSVPPLKASSVKAAVVCRTV